MNGFFHSVTLCEEKCTGCTNCIKRCPTEAIRVRNGKAAITPERCIDCSMCIRVCPNHAKKAKSTKLSNINSYKYKVAIPAPALYGQFNNLDDIDYILNGLEKLGFDKIYEVSKAAEIVSDATRKFLKSSDIARPVISSACPAVVRLIRVKFPNLCKNVLPLLSPMETAAREARKQAQNETNFNDEDIGVFFISPCAAKVTDILSPIGYDKSACNGAIAISDIYSQLTSEMNKITNMNPISESGIIGVSWSTVGGESAALLNEKYLAADGIENVISILEDLEDEKLQDLDFIELNACPGGCVGGIFTVENPFVAKAKIQRLRKYLPVSCNHLKEFTDDMLWNEELKFEPVMTLSSDINSAMEMMNKIDEICKRLPGLDCGSCGAPSCRAFAEDVVKGLSSEFNCIFILKEKIANIAHGITGVISNGVASNSIASNANNLQENYKVRSETHESI